MERMAEIKQSLSISISIADAMLEGAEVAATRALQEALKEAGVPDGTPVEVSMYPRKYDYEVTGTWSNSTPNARRS